MTDDELPTSPEVGAPVNRLGTLLAQHGIISRTQLQAAQALQSDIALALIDLGFVSDDELTAFFVKTIKMPRLSLQDYQVNPETVKKLPQAVCERYRVLPIDILGKSLTLAMVNPLDDVALAAAQAACPEYRIKPFLCTRRDFEFVAERVFKEESPENQTGGAMSLDSLGLRGASPAKKPAPAPEPTPEAVVEIEDEGDAMATMLFDGKAGAAPRSAGPLRSSLICLDGWELGREVEITGESHTLGRSPDANTTVKSPLISRVHAKLTRNAEYGQETFVITDLNSSNGTFVNNIPVTTTILRHGDRILLGDVLFKFVLLDEIEARFHKDVHHLYSIHKDTGLLPADAWRKELDRAVATLPEGGLSASLIQIDDIDRIRQAHGHIAGTIVLNDLCDILNRYLDKTDLPGDYGVGRIAVLFGGKPIESVFPAVEDLRRTVEAHVFHNKDSQFKCTISVGVGALSAPGSAPEAFIATLEQALASAVSGGKNQTTVAQ